MPLRRSVFLRAVRFLPLDPVPQSVIIQPLNIETSVEISTDTIRDLTLLEEIEQDPDINQSALAVQLGVAVGTVNWHLKRLIEKGAIKVKRATRRKLRYIITPEGIALRAHLTMDFIQQSFKLYRLIRSRAQALVPLIHQSGYPAVRIKATGDAEDVIRLTCVENQILVVDEGEVPIIEMQGLKLYLRQPGEESI